MLGRSTAAEDVNDSTWPAEGLIDGKGNVAKNGDTAGKNACAT